MISFLTSSVTSIHKNFTYKQLYDHLVHSNHPSENKRHYQIEDHSITARESVASGSKNPLTLESQWEQSYFEKALFSQHF